METAISPRPIRGKPLAADALERVGGCPLAGNRHRARRVDALRQPQRAAVCKQDRTGPGVSDRTRREDCRATRCQADAGMGGQRDPVSPRRLRPRARRHRPQGYAARGRCADFASLSSQRRRARGAQRFAGVVAGKSRFRSAGRGTGRLAGLHDARQGRRRHLPVRIRGRDCCSAWPIARSRQPPSHR